MEIHSIVNQWLPVIPVLDDPMPQGNFDPIESISYVPPQPFYIRRLKIRPNPKKPTFALSRFKDMTRIGAKQHQTDFQNNIIANSPNMCKQKCYSYQASHMQTGLLQQHRNPWTWNWQFLKKEYSISNFHTLFYGGKTSITDSTTNFNKWIRVMLCMAIYTIPPTYGSNTCMQQTQ